MKALIIFIGAESDVICYLLCFQLYKAIEEYAFFSTNQYTSFYERYIELIKAPAVLSMPRKPVSLWDQNIYYFRPLQ